MTQSITLTASMRSNLSSLKSIQGQMDTTQTRLSTGKKVNSAIDNASSYYQSRALTNRASDLDSLLDSMGQGIQTIQAANQGIESITAFIEQAKSVANSAFALDVNASDYASQLENYQDQFNKILTEIGTLAQDASYQGVNLLTDGDLTVMFNETRTHSLTVNGKDVVSDMATSHNFTTATWADTVVANKTAMDTAESDMNTALTNALKETNMAAFGDDYKYTYNESTKTFTLNASAVAGVTKYYKNSLVEAYNDAKGDYTDAVSTYEGSISNTTTGSVALVNKSLKAVADATGYLRDYSAELGNNFAIIETRQNFTEALIDVLETGSDNLVLADMNEESANYLALQTRQQLAINSLALASQSAQSVLKLF